jgi:hypothetical protein
MVASNGECCSNSQQNGILEILSLSLCIHTYTYMCVCVCVCVHTYTRALISTTRRPGSDLDVWYYLSMDKKNLLMRRFWLQGDLQVKQFNNCLTEDGQ